MEHRNVHVLAQLFLDDEAVGRLDVFKVDAAEGGTEIAHRVDEGVRVLGIDLHVDGVDIGEALEQRRLAFHHRLGRECPEIAQPQDRGAVGNDGDHVALDRVVVGERGIFGDGAHGHRHPRRVGEREIALRRHGLGRHDLQLARLVAVVKLKRVLIGELRPFPGPLGVACHTLVPYPLRVTVLSPVRSGAAARLQIAH